MLLQSGSRILSKKNNLFLLDSYPAPLGYSLRKISSSVTNAVRLRRDSDNAEQDIGFVNNELDVQSVVDFMPTIMTGRSLKVGSVTLNLVTSPDDSSLRITEDMTLIFHLKAADYSVAAQDILKKYGTPGNRGYIVRINGAGLLSFLWSNDGTTQNSENSNSAIPFVGGQDIWLKIDMDVDNGAGGYTVTFSSSLDGAGWTPFSTNIGGSPTSIFASTDQLELFTGFVSGEAYRVIIKDGIDGITVFDADFTNKIALTRQFIDVTGKIVTVNTGKPFVTTWYNQGSLGSVGDFTQTTQTTQPFLALENGKPAIQFDGVADELTNFGVDKSTVFSTTASTFMVYTPDNDLNYTVFDNNSGDSWMCFNGGKGYLGLFASPRLSLYYTGFPTSGTQLATFIAGATYDLYLNGSPLQTGGTYNYDYGSNGVGLKIGSSFVNSFQKYFKGTVKDIIIYNTDETFNRTAIEILVDDFKVV